jgi:alpha-1,6-mannosyltransferase
MLLPAMASISLLLDGRDRWSGATLALAVAVKFTAILLLPFLLLAARPVRRQVRLVGGMVLAAAPLLATSIVAFGHTVPNLSDQSSLLTDFSIPNLLGLVLGQGGGTPTLVRLASVFVIVVVAMFVWRRGDWLTGAGWSMLALVCSLAWLVPWYVVWVLPLAALGSSIRLRRATIVFTVFLVLTFTPATSLIMNQLHLSTMSGAASQASVARQARLEH